MLVFRFPAESPLFAGLGGIRAMRLTFVIEHFTTIKYYFYCDGNR